MCLVASPSAPRAWLPSQMEPFGPQLASMRRVEFGVGVLLVSAVKCYHTSNWAAFKVQDKIAFGGAERVPKQTAVLSECVRRQVSAGQKATRSSVGPILASCCGGTIISPLGWLSSWARRSPTLTSHRDGSLRSARPSKYISTTSHLQAFGQQKEKRQSAAIGAAPIAQ